MGRDITVTRNRAVPFYDKKSDLYIKFPRIPFLGCTGNMMNLTTLNLMLAPQLKENGSNIAALIPTVADPSVCTVVNVCLMNAFTKQQMMIIHKQVPRACTAITICFFLLNSQMLKHGRCFTFPEDLWLWTDTLRRSSMFTQT